MVIGIILNYFESRNKIKRFGEFEVMNGDIFLD
jgi:hypothetical protein